MGCYDTYGRLEMQLKCGECLLNNFAVGDKVDIQDGVYVAYEGVAVVKDGIFIAEFENLTDKWGGKISPEEIIESRNPIGIYLKVIKIDR